MLVGTRALLGEGWNCRAAERAGRHDDRHHRRDRAADARPLAAAGPGRPREGRLQLGRRLRRARSRARDGRLRALRAQAPAPVRARRGRRGRGRARRTCTRSSGPFAPPPVERFAALNAAQLERATDRATARERWQVGTPYRGVELPTLLVRPSRPGTPAPELNGSARSIQLSQRVPIAGGLGGAAAFGVLGVATGAPIELAGLRSRRPGSAGRRGACAAAKKRLPLVLPLDAAARAVAEAYRELGELSAEAAALADDRAARRRLPALRADQGDAGRGPQVRGRARRADERLGRARATSSRARWPTRTAGRWACSAAC